MIHRGLLAPFSTAIVVVAGVFATFHFGGIRVNASASLPIGLYRTTSDLAARLVEFCPSEASAKLSAKRAYRGKGDCPDRAEPLMKPIVAIDGDIVTFSPSGVAVNGRLLRNSAPRRLDTNNRPLQHWPFGTYRVCPDTAWVISSFNARSFDSRYFGPIQLSSVRSHLQRLLTE
ncbi:MAG: conjugative transfer signal peptidase TraF [Bryobacteraceae bacterium]